MRPGPGPPLLETISPSLPAAPGVSPLSGGREAPDAGGREGGELLGASNLEQLTLNF